MTQKTIHKKSLKGSKGLKLVIEMPQEQSTVLSDPIEITKFDIIVDTLLATLTIGSILSVLVLACRSLM